MKALQLTAPNKLALVDIDRPVLGDSQVLIKMNAVALNRRDQWIREGKYPNIQMNTTLGSDGCGEVVEASGDVAKVWLGKKVLINPNVNWGENPDVQSKFYSVLGMPAQGTFSEYMAVDIDRLVEQPKHLSDAQAGALPLGGLTAFRALMHHGKLKNNDNVLISGFGGGVALFAFQIAAAFGAKVYVTSGSESKLDLAVNMGAKKGFNYKDENWQKEALNESKGFDVVIDSAGGDQLNSFVKMMRPAGRIVFYGATNGLPSNLDLYRLFWNQITLQGSTMGNDEEFVEMVQFFDKQKLTPVVDSIRPFHDIMDAFDQMKEGNRVGKLVVQID